MSQTNEPKKSKEQPKDQVTSLNADDLNVQELDEKLLESAAGGQVSPCLTHIGCNNNVC